MEAGKRLSHVWSYLPVFRVVAETEHLPTAAKRLRVSPSALSRSIKLLEEGIGEALFVRSSRRIVLNAAGERLLRTLRLTMGNLERSVGELLSHEFSGEYRVSSLGVLTDHFVLPALLELSAERQSVIPCMTTLSSIEANRKLASGLLEAAFYYDATAQDGIHCRKIGSLSNSLFCGRGHPLFGKGADAKSLASHPFSIPAIGDRGTPMDGWPVEIPRTAGFQILMLSTNHRVALSGRFVCVLPDVVAEPDLRAGLLHRLEPDVVPDTPVYAACREEDATASFTMDVIARVETELRRAPVLRVSGSSREPKRRKNTRKKPLRPRKKPR
ncbi:MAG: LysR family transcriptional regulator [Polyangiaceae bacterium]